MRFLEEFFPANIIEMILGFTGETERWKTIFTEQVLCEIDLKWSWVGSRCIKNIDYIERCNCSRRVLCGSCVRGQESCDHYIWVHIPTKQYESYGHVGYVPQRINLERVPEALQGRVLEMLNNDMIDWYAQQHAQSHVSEATTNATLFE